MIEMSMAVGLSGLRRKRIETLLDYYDRKQICIVHERVNPCGNCQLERRVRGAVLVVALATLAIIVAGRVL